MTIRYTKQFLSKLEDLFAESDYSLRYEKGRFKSGYCVLNDHQVAIVNKYYPTEGKISALIDILKDIKIDNSNLSEKNRNLLRELSQIEIKL
ncbi:MAG: hypothetical protein ACJAXX_000429 [Roseivirga sp.]|jgi:hypothetical protein